MPRIYHLNLYYVGVFLIFLLFNFAQASYYKKIVVIIPSYNNKDWYIKNLDSVFNQVYINFKVIYIDDCSTDGTANLVEAYIKKKKLKNKITLVKNTERKGSLANIYAAVHSCKDECIIIDLDGDDWLKHKYVLSHINRAYMNPNVWLTYGSYEIVPSNVRGHCTQVPYNIIKENNFRDYKFVTSALRTFYAWLFKKIKIEDLMYGKNFFSMAADQGFMFPMLEMAAERCKYIEEILYVYNQYSLINDHKVDRELQIFYRNYIRALPRYKRLNNAEI